MIQLLQVVFLVSGAASLAFETLWFRQAGLAFGNGVWASSIVLASFMAGLALGNLLAAAIGDRSEHPIRLYALLELASQKRAGELPVALHRGGADVEHSRHLLDAEAAEELQLDDPTLASVDLLQTLHGPVQSDDVDTVLLQRLEHVVEGMRSQSPPRLRVARARA